MFFMLLIHISTYQIWCQLDIIYYMIYKFINHKKKIEEYIEYIESIEDIRRRCNPIVDL